MKPRLTYIAFLAVLVVALQAPSSAQGATADGAPMAVVRPGIDLRLVGTAVSYQSEKSLAVVEIDGRNQTYLREGDVVGDIQIKKILRDRVIVDAGRGQESVKLRQSLSAGTKIQSEVNLTLATPQSFGPRPPESRKLKVVYLDRESKKSLLGDIDGTLKKMRIDPVSVYGQTTGIRISPIEPGSVFSEMGLKSNEVIRQVDGKEVTGPGDAVALFQRMNEGGEFNIKVKGRRTRQIHIIVE